MNNYCNSCDSCNSCNSCNSCDSCDYCNSCNSCNYCNSCDYCKNLKMTEYNLFCYSESYNDEKSFQQERYRAFNIVVEKTRFYELKNLVGQIIQNPNRLKLSDLWKSLTNGQWKELLDIPEAKDFKDGFEFISGQKINLELTIEITVKINNKESKLSDISEETLLKLREIK